jgi:hypothetical protein
MLAFVFLFFSSYFSYGTLNFILFKLICCFQVPKKRFKNTKRGTLTLSVLEVLNYPCNK